MNDSTLLWYLNFSFSYYKNAFCSANFFNMNSIYPSSPPSLVVSHNYRSLHSMTVNSRAAPYLALAHLAQLDYTWHTWHLITQGLPTPGMNKLQKHSTCSTPAPFLPCPPHLLSLPPPVPIVSAQTSRFYLGLWVHYFYLLWSCRWVVLHCSPGAVAEDHVSANPASQGAWANAPQAWWTYLGACCCRADPASNPHSAIVPVSLGYLLVFLVLMNELWFGYPFILPNSFAIIIETMHSLAEIKGTKQNINHAGS